MAAKMKRILIVGAGLTGAVMARQLVELGDYVVDVIESRHYVGGNCYTKEDSRTGIMVHEHGPHIFHTNNQMVWDYIRRYDEFVPYICQVKATTQGRVFSLPINLLTINQFFSKTFSPPEAYSFLQTKVEKKLEVKTFEDQALNFLGRELYEAFFYGYPIKQWGMLPSELPASILKRLPIRYNYNDNYFEHKYQGIPKHGYTHVIEKILSHERINLYLNSCFKKEMQQNYHHTIYTGTLDSWFNHKYGRLGYRTLKFEKSYHEGDFQGCAVMSYPEEHIPYTRITEHKHFTPWNDYPETVVFHEFSDFCGTEDIPYYPIRLVDEKRLLSQYVELAEQEKMVTFMGRLGTYRYLDMDVTILEALEGATKMHLHLTSDKDIAVFFNHPMF